jgi:uncharacterized protein YrzB (UPF0473 family)
MQGYNLPDESDSQIIIPGENGEQHLFEVLFTFDVDSTGKSYMVLAPEGTDEEDDEEEEVEVHAFRYEEPEDEDIALIPIESDEGWALVEELLNTVTEHEME